jgi:leucyl aminopeptidase
VPPLDEILQVQGQLFEIFKKRKFTGKSGETLLLTGSKNSHHYILYFVGIGKKGVASTDLVELYRRAIGTGIRSAVSHHAESIVIAIPSELSQTIDAYVLGKEAVIGVEMTSYTFYPFLTDESEKRPIKELIFCMSEMLKAQFESGLAEGQIIAEAVNKVRHLVDMPPSHMTPTILAQEAEAITQKNDAVTLTIFHKPDLERLKMGGILGVARGSTEEPKLVILEYRPKNAKNKQPILLVGKGITFDSGGLSIKPAVSMETMKDDMAGAAAVIATVEAVARLKLPVSVVALAPMTENMPGGSAIKPGDILKFYNGKTAEVKNTDAEGRLILADALSYGVKHYHPSFVIDIATLTGACAHALGPFHTGLFSEDDELVALITEAGKRAGDYVWRLPMGDDYKKAIKSQIADICNIGDGRIKAGASTAAHFLQNFVGNARWAHLDIAGTAFDVPNIPYYGHGATGAGVRLLVQFIRQQAV